jgi:CubicO group peptidase (beta-lactamase class C family)
MLRLPHAVRLPPSRAPHVLLAVALVAGVLPARAETSAAKAAPFVPGVSLPLATPESQGMSRTRLDRMHDEMRRLVDEGKHAGVLTLVARNGRVVDLYHHGSRDLETAAPMQPDTIFRIYSMTKIVTSVAALMLLEEARFKLSAPVGDFLPELARMKVWAGGTAEKPLLADAQKPITIEHLLTHSSGLIYGFGDAPIEHVYKDAKMEEWSSTADLLAHVARLPLAQEPGTSRRSRARASGPSARSASSARCG